MLGVVVVQGVLSEAQDSLELQWFHLAGLFSNSYLRKNGLNVMYVCEEILKSLELLCRMAQPFLKCEIMDSLKGTG